MPCDEPRSQLAAMQAALVLGLTRQGEGPDCFDRTGLAVTAAALASKRARSVARAWPGLADALGDRFAECFVRYAEHSAIPVHGGPLADGYAFARALAANGALPDAGRLEVMGVRLRNRCCASGLVPRRSPSVAIAWLHQQRRLVLAGRLPRLGECWIWAGLICFGWRATPTNL